MSPSTHSLIFRIFLATTIIILPTFTQAASTPPACVLAAVNTQSNPHDISAVCKASEVQDYIVQKCGSDVQKEEAQKWFSEVCQGAGVEVSATLPSSSSDDGDNSSDSSSTSDPSLSSDDSSNTAPSVTTAQTSTSSSGSASEASSSAATVGGATRWRIDIVGISLVVGLSGMMIGL